MDVNSILNSVMGTAGAGIDKAVQTARSGSMPGGLVGGVAAGGLAALLLSNKKARKMGGKALAYGGMAAVGGLAYKAWRDHKDAQSNSPPPSADARMDAEPPAPRPAQSQAAPQRPVQAYDAQGRSTAAQIPPPPTGSIFDLANQQATDPVEDIRLVLIRAMISAAKADGHIDGEERARIEDQIQALEIGQAEQRFLIDQLNAPSDPIAIARLSKGPEQAAEIYVASSLAVDVDTPEEHRYLERLADALHLPDDLRQRIDAETAAR